MQTSYSFIVRTALLLFASVASFQLPAFAQNTAFTYQGKLNDAPGPATGVYDFQFAIYDASVNGNQIGSFVTNSATPVTNGLFTVMLDFGGVFTGGSNWLDIAVRTNGGASFTELLPRQQITSVPYAMTANTASNLSGTLAASRLTGAGTLPLSVLPSIVALVNSNLTFTGVNTFSTNVGIGAPPGSIPFYIRDTRSSTFPTAKLEADSNIGTWLELQNDASGHNWSLISSGSGNGEGPGKLLFRDQSVFTTRMVISTNGNVGIGTVNPTNTLSVGGTADFSGYVGIGTASPQSPLHIVGSNAYPHLTVAAASNAPYGAFLSLDATATTDGKDFLIFSTGGAAGEGNGKLVFQNHTDGYQILCLTSNGGVGVGTTFPQDEFHVVSSVGVRARVESGGSTYAGFLSKNSQAEWFNGVNGLDGNGVWEVYENSPLGGSRLLITPGGNVGIGTTNPAAKLQVVGDIISNGKLMTGSGGTNYAASSTEYLRIVRGSLNGDGTTARGSGFTAVHNGPVGTGSYTITFTPAFSGTPTVTVTAVNVAARAGGSISSSSVTVSTINFSTSASVDDSFSFIAIGPY